MKSKKTQGHIEMMLSMVLFVGALIFIFLFLNPFSKTKEKTYLIEEVDRIVIEAISENIGKLSVFVFPQQGDNTDCYYFDEYVYGSIYKQVKETTGTPIKYTIYFSNIFADSPGTSLNREDCESTFFKLGSYSEEKMIVYKKITDLKYNYETDYIALKKSLGITRDFSFSFNKISNNDLDINKINIDSSNLKRPQKRVNVYLTEYPVRIINNNGELYELMFNIKVW